MICGTFAVLPLLRPNDLFYPLSLYGKLGLSFIYDITFNRVHVR